MLPSRARPPPVIDRPCMVRGFRTIKRRRQQHPPVARHCARARRTRAHALPHPHPSPLPPPSPKPKQTPFTSLPRGVHVRCLAFHPRRALLALGLGTHVGGVDLHTGARVGRVDVRSPPVAMAFSRDGSLLVVATEQWHVLGVDPATWAARAIAPCRDSASRPGPLSDLLLAVTPGPRPVVFFTPLGKDSVRMAYAAGAAALQQAVAAAASAARRGGTSAAQVLSGPDRLRWGIKLKLDCKKPVVGLAAHPSEPQLLVMCADGALRGYALSRAGLTPLYALGGLDPLGGRAAGAPGKLTAVPHPFVRGGCLLLHGTRAGGLAVAEALGRDEPRLLLRARSPGSVPVLDVGYHAPSRTVVAVVPTPGGGARALAWRVYLRPGAVAAAGSALVAEAAAQAAGSSVAVLSPVAVDLPEALELGAAGAGGAAELPDGALLAGDEAAAWAGGMDQARAGAGGGGGGGKHRGGAAATPPPPPSWQDFWAAGDEGALSAADAAPTAEADASGALLLGKLLLPVVAGAALHPHLGVVALRRAPPAALRQARAIMGQPVAGVSPAEAAVTRKTASVALLAMRADARPAGITSSSGPLGAVAPLHTRLDFWQQAGGGGGGGGAGGSLADAATLAAALGGDGGGELAGVDPALAAAMRPRLQFPCHLYFLSGGRLCKYALASKAAGGVVADLPATSAPGAGAAEGGSRATESSKACPGRPLEARYLVHSAKQRAWLAFFESPVAPAPEGGGIGGGGGDNGGGDDGNRPLSSSSRAAVQPHDVVPAARLQWWFTLVRADGGSEGRAAARSAGGSTSSSSPWALPGKYGCFLGPRDAFFAVQAAGPSAPIGVYHTRSFDGRSGPLYTVGVVWAGMDGGGGGGLGGGLGFPAAEPALLPGPPCREVPRPGADVRRAERKRREAELRAKRETRARQGGIQGVDERGEKGGRGGEEEARERGGGGSDGRRRRR